MAYLSSITFLFKYILSYNNLKIFLIDQKPFIYVF